MLMGDLSPQIYDDTNGYGTDEGKAWNDALRGIEKLRI